MHRPPPSYERTGGDHFGERNSWRVETTPSLLPFKAPTTPQHVPPPCGCKGGGGTFEESTFHITPQFLTKKEEFSTYPSSGLCWRDIPRVEGEACGRATYFQVSVATKTQCFPLRIRSQTRKRCFVACPVCQMEQSISARSSRKRLHIQVIDSKLDLILISVGVLVTGSLELTVSLQLCEHCQCCSNEMYL